MTAQPTDTMTAPPPFLAARANEDTARALIAFTRLPALAVTASAEDGHVTVAGDSDLGDWLYALGGTVSVSAPHAGMQMWTLHTWSWLRADGSRLPMLVHVLLPVDAPVDADVLAAVSR